MRASEQYGSNHAASSARLLFKQSCAELCFGFDAMKLAGFLLLLAGFAIVFSAFLMLASQPARAAFVIAGVVVEIIGLALACRAHIYASAGDEH